jgi:hypothetical protein
MEAAIQHPFTRPPLSGLVKAQLSAGCSGITGDGMMRFVSPVALGLMLALGGVSLGVAAPVALAKEKGEKAPQLKPTPAFVPLAQKLDEAIKKKDVEGAKAAMAAAQAGVKSNDDKYYYNSMVLNLSILANDAAMQNEALKGMLESGFVPESQQGQFNTIVANNALSKKDYDSRSPMPRRRKPWVTRPIRCTRSSRRRSGARALATPRKPRAGWTCSKRASTR